MGFEDPTVAAGFSLAPMFLLESRKDPRLPFAGPAVVVAVHVTLIRTMAPRDPVGVIAPQRRAVAVRPAPRSGRAWRGRLTRR